MAAIFRQRKQSTIPLKRPNCLSLDHPANLQATIAHTQPGNTADISEKQKVEVF